MQDTGMPGSALLRNDGRTPDGQGLSATGCRPVAVARRRRRVMVCNQVAEEGERGLRRGKEREGGERGGREGERRIKAATDRPDSLPGSWLWAGRSFCPLCKMGRNGILGLLEAVQFYATRANLGLSPSLSFSSLSLGTTVLRTVSRNGATGREW